MIEEPERRDLAAYALAMLEDPVRARVEAHVRACADCAEELSEYQAVIALLPHALNIEAAPGEVWEMVEARIRARDKATAGGAGLARWWPGRWAKVTHVLQPAFAATLAAAVIGLIAWNASLQVRLSHRQTAIDLLASAPDETVVALVGSSQASGLDGHLIMSKDRRQGGLVVAGLPALSSGRSYQIWFVRADQSRAAAGTFRVDRLGQGVAVVAVPQPAREFDGVAITEEPDGGSTSPTGHDLLAGPIYER